MLPVQGAQIWSLVSELRSHMVKGQKFYFCEKEFHSSEAFKKTTPQIWGSSGPPCSQCSHLYSFCWSSRIPCGVGQGTEALTGCVFVFWPDSHSCQLLSWDLDPGSLSEWEGKLFAQSCPTLWDLIDCSLSGSSVHGIFQARILMWVAISFSSGSSQPRDRTLVSRIVGRCFYCLSHQGSP